MAHDPTIDDYENLQAKLNRVLAERRRRFSWIEIISGIICTIALIVAAFVHAPWIADQVRSAVQARTTIQSLPTAAPASAPLARPSVPAAAPDSAGQVPAAAPIAQQEPAQQAQEPPAQPDPVVSETQVDQQELALQLAADEAAQSQLDARREDASSRPPDISADAAKALVRRNPCSVPRADPQTCAAGSWAAPTVVAAP